MEKQSLRPCLDDLARTADGGYNLAAYLVSLLLCRHNGGAGDDDTMRQYMRWLEGEEESQAVAVGGGGKPTSRWLSNEVHAVPPPSHQGDLQYDMGTVVAATADTGAHRSSLSRQRLR